MSEVWSKWQGHVVNDTFPLRRCLGSSDHSGVFLTDFAGREPTEVAIKLVRVTPALVDSYRQQWELAASLEHPQLLRLLETGRCELDGQPYLYLLMEYADQTLAQLLEHRALSEDEAVEMLLPILDTLAFLHNRNLVQGQLKPANILVVGDGIRLASDTIRSVSEATASINMVSAYDPPEVHDGTISTAGDLWALGVSLFEALTRSPPIGLDVRREGVVLPGDFSPMFRDIVGGCLSRRPFDRPKAAELAARMRGVDWEGVGGGAAGVAGAVGPAAAAGAAGAVEAGVAGVGLDADAGPGTAAGALVGSAGETTAASATALASSTPVAMSVARTASVTVSGPTNTAVVPGASNAVPDVGAVSRLASAAGASVSSAAAAAARLASGLLPDGNAGSRSTASGAASGASAKSSATAAPGLAIADGAAAARNPSGTAAESTGTHRALSESQRQPASAGAAPGSNVAGGTPAVRNASGTAPGSTGTHRSLSESQRQALPAGHRQMTSPTAAPGAPPPPAARIVSPGIAGGTNAASRPAASIGVSSHSASAAHAAASAHAAVPAPTAVSASALAAGAAATARAASTAQANGGNAHRTASAPVSGASATVARSAGAAAPGERSAAHRPTASALHAPTTSAHSSSAAAPDPAKIQRPPPKPIVIEHFTPESLMPEMAVRQPSGNTAQTSAAAPRAEERVKGGASEKALSSQAGASHSAAPHGAASTDTASHLAPPHKAPSGTTVSHPASPHGASSNDASSYTAWASSAPANVATSHAATPNPTSHATPANGATPGNALSYSALTDAAAAEITWAEATSTTTAEPEAVVTDGADEESSVPRFLLPVAAGAIVLLALAVMCVLILRSRTNTTPVVESYQEEPLPTSSDSPPPAGTDEPTALPVSATSVTRARSMPSAAAQPAAPRVVSTKEIHEELPEVPSRVLHTIRGHVRVSVRLIVDKEGTVFAALVDEPGPSLYFERLAIEAAKKWTFPPLDTTASRLELVRFEFTRQGATGRAMEVE